MSGSIGDLAGILRAVRFHAAVADGRSIRGAPSPGRSTSEPAGPRDHDLPTLAHRDGVDPRATHLLTPR